MNSKVKVPSYTKRSAQQKAMRTGELKAKVSVRRAQRKVLERYQ